MIRLKAVLAAAARTVGRHAWIQAIMGLSCIAAIIYLCIAGRPVPDILAAIVWAIIGFYFGAITREASQGPGPGQGTA